MKCDACAKEREFGTALCRGCLTKVVEKRARKELGRARIAKGAKIAIVNDGSCQGAVNEFIARKLITIAKLTVLKKAPQQGHGLILLPDTADTEAQRFLEAMLGRKSRAIVPSGAKLLRDSLGSEVRVYAAIKRIKYKASEKKTDVAELIGKLEEKYRGTTFSLAKSARQLE